MNPSAVSPQPIDKLTPNNEVRYKDVVTQILQVANQHKSNLALTALVGSLPIMIGIISLAIISSTSSVNGSSHTDAANHLSLSTAILLVVMIMSFAVTPFWLVLINRISRIEQILWVKAYFDKDSDKSHQSLRKALSLFWPSVLLSIGTFLRYYWVFLTAVIIFVASLAYAVVREYQTISPTYSPNGLILLVLLSPVIVLVAYFLVAQFVSLKTRYVQIIFVNNYGKPGFSYDEVFAQNKRLTQRDAQGGGKSFGKLLRLAVGTDATVTAASGVAIAPASVAATTIVGVLSGSSVAAKAAGTLTMFYGAEATSLSESLAQTIIFYLYYLSATNDESNVSS